MTTMNQRLDRVASALGADVTDQDRAAHDQRVVQRGVEIVAEELGIPVEAVMKEAAELGAAGTEAIFADLAAQGITREEVMAEADRLMEGMEGAGA